MTSASLGQDKHCLFCACGRPLGHTLGTEATGGGRQIPFNEAHVSLFLATSRGRHHLFSESNATPSLPGCSGVDNIARIDPRRRSIFFRSAPVAALLSKVQEASAQKKRCLVPCLVALRCWSLRADAQRIKGPSRFQAFIYLIATFTFPGLKEGDIKVSLPYQSDNVRAPQS